MQEAGGPVSGGGGWDGHEVGRGGHLPVQGAERDTQAVLF